MPADLRLDERLAGGLMGLLVGDALGVPYEFRAPDQLPAEHLIEYLPPPDFDRAHVGVPPGTWSDDGAQALCLLASLLAQGRLDLDDFGQRLLRWYEAGYLAVDAQVFDVGVTTGQALLRLRAGVPPSQSGAAGQHDNGNGSLMRVLPLALWHRGSDRDLVIDAHAQSLPTHAHLRAQVCCALYALWARRTLAGAHDAWPQAVHALREVYRDMPDAMQELMWSVRPDDAATGRGSGYVVDALRSARDVQTAGTYERVVRAAIRLGHDTDTTACLAGGIAGLRGGLAAIPAHWRDGLRGADLVKPLLVQLQAWRA